MGTSWRDYVRYGEKGQQNPAAKRLGSPAQKNPWSKGVYRGSQITIWRKKKALEAKYVREYLYNG